MACLSLCLKKYYILCVWMICLHVSLCIIYVQSPWRPKESVRSSGLALQRVVSHHVGAENQNQLLYISSNNSEPLSYLCSLSFIIIIIIIVMFCLFFLCLDIFCLHICVNHICAYCPRKSESASHPLGLGL